VATVATAKTQLVERVNARSAKIKLVIARDARIVKRVIARDGKIVKRVIERDAKIVTRGIQCPVTFLCLGNLR
jgi:hypothetical protein